MSSQSENQLIRSIQSEYTRLAEAVAAAEFWQKQGIVNAEQDYQKRVTALNNQYQQDIANADAAYAPAPKEQQRRLEASKSRYEHVSQEILSAYETAGASITAARQDLLETVNFLTKAWDDPVWHDWQPHNNQALPEVVRFGQLRAAGHWETGSFPAFLPLFVGGQSILFEASGAAKERAVKAIQSCLLRLLACVPPGKLKLIFLDPVALGHNAAPFMHLADYDEALVTGKAWSEKNHLEQRLVDLTEHISNVIQKYLRNQYATIEEFNAQAGEVAEPYRLLVVFDFPVNFSEDAARRLVSVVQNGARCGVYAIMLADDQQKFPYGFNLSDLQQSAMVISWDGKRFIWKDRDFQECDLELDQPPNEEFFNNIVNAVGKSAVEASKVEVPFEKVLEKAELTEPYWWQGSTAEGIQIPLGPIGAKKVQYLDFGKGTAQHALVAGKTGSGKSTLLHILISTLTLKYSPEEVELYLIDFKKGVEFKTYATHQLPHARVIAIESEREFGLSVLEGLDTELKRRGDLFRNTGVDGVKDFRQKTNEKLPRILLLVDEFQEFFTEDDAIEAKCKQILDRLVRQGRAFGIHVLLGSQTLAGAYSLARSTIDQMAIRIALQCSEADSRLILSDDNPAARLLSRPGEAIYNSANGLVEGNNPFQVAWLPDEKQDLYLDKVKALAEEKGFFPPKQQIVFEGNAPAHPDRNLALNDLFDSAQSPSRPERSRRAAWLGEPIAIKAETKAYFRRQSGSNLLIVGQNEEAAMGLCLASLLSLAAQYPPAAAAFYLLDFGNVDAPYSQVLNAAAEMLSQVKYGKRRQLPEFLDAIAQTVNRRLESEPLTPTLSQDGSGGDETLSPQLGREGRVSGVVPAIYLFIYGLQRARDLEKDDGFNSSFDFSAPPAFGAEEPAPPPPANPGKQLAKIVREGPDLGIHTILWCDTYTNLQRRLDRQFSKEFEMRVVFQMSNEDSLNLIDANAASKLGQHRALFFSEEEGRLEKFRPFALPSEQWLQHVSERLREKE